MKAGVVQLRSVDQEETERSALAVAGYADLADLSTSCATDGHNDAYQLAAEPDLLVPQLACAEALSATHAEHATSASINEGSTKRINRSRAPFSLIPC